MDSINLGINTELDNESSPSDIEIVDPYDKIKVNTKMHVHFIIGFLI